MAEEPTLWSNRPPGDLSVRLPEVQAGIPEEAVTRAVAASGSWGRTPLAERAEALRRVGSAIAAEAEGLAKGIASETGKPIREARGEVQAVISKVELTIADAEEFLSDESVSSGPHPASVRRIPRGPAAVIAPFNFPLHLGNGAALAYLIAGNPVIFKPSPWAAGVAAAYGRLVAGELPEGVFQIVQGWSVVARALCAHPAVRSICFTGSVAAGRALSVELAHSYDKDLALELGGKNASIICRDADLELAATAVAESLCLTTGQRCNATTRVLMESGIEGDFLQLLVSAMSRFRPGNPLNEETTLGPLINHGAVHRYQDALADLPGEVLLPGGSLEEVEGFRGHYVNPVVTFCRDASEAMAAESFREEIFAPVLIATTFSGDEDAVRIHDASPYGLSASIFTRSRERFAGLGSRLRVGNLYANIPTTFSPSTLPFGGLALSGNRHPGGRWFVRFASDEQAIQWKADGFA